MDDDIEDLCDSCGTDVRATEQLIDSISADRDRLRQECDALRDALAELLLRARKLRHSAECGHERRKGLDAIDAAIREAARLLAAPRTEERT